MRHVFRLPKAKFQEMLRLLNAKDIGPETVLHGVKDFVFMREEEVSAPKQLMTREEAFIKVQAITHGSWTNRDMDDILDVLVALGLIKLANTGQDEVWMAKAKKYSESMVEYDYTNPVRTINEMATVISFLYRKLTGIGLREWMNSKGYEE